MTDQRGRVLMAALGFAGCPHDTTTDTTHDTTPDTTTHKPANHVSPRPDR